MTACRGRRRSLHWRDEAIAIGSMGPLRGGGGDLSLEDALLSRNHFICGEGGKGKWGREVHEVTQM